MGDKVETTPTGIEPESGIKFRPYTEDAPDDAEGHALRGRPVAEDAPEAEGAYRPGRAADEDDVEGHMPLKRGVAEPGPGEAVIDDTEGHMPFRRGATEDAPKESDVNKAGLPDDLEDAEDVEGHIRKHRG
jgi:hypothetical protein